MFKGCWHHSKIMFCSLVPCYSLRDFFLSSTRKKESRKAALSAVWNTSLAVSCRGDSRMLLSCCVQLMIHRIFCVVGHQSCPSQEHILPSVSSFSCQLMEMLRLKNRKLFFFFFNESEQSLFLSVVKSLLPDWQKIDSSSICVGRIPPDSIC